MIRFENENKTTSKPKRLTIGFRAKIVKNEPDYENHEVILSGRSSNNSFSVLVLKSGTNLPLIESCDTVIGEYAWVDEEDMVVVDTDIDTNLEFMDWYDNHKHECPKCGDFELFE